MAKKESKKAINNSQAAKVAENTKDNIAISKKEESKAQLVTTVDKAETVALEETAIVPEFIQEMPVESKEESYNLAKLSIRELLDYENAARLACTKYENMIKCHDGSINYNLPNGAAFKKYNMIHSKILDEICTRLNKLVF